MINQCIKNSLVFFLAMSMVFSPLLRAAKAKLPTSDIIAPTLIHDVFIGNIVSGQDYTFEATATDNEYIESVSLYYRPLHSSAYKRVSMKRIKDTYFYTYTLDKSELKPPGIEYYIEAVDTSKNSLTAGFAFSPLIVNVSKSIEQIVATSEQPELAPIEESTTNKWLWIGLGVLVLAAAAGGGGGGGGGAAGSTASSSTVVVTTPLP